MWILIPLEVKGPGTGAAHYLLPSKDYVVGRKSCDVLLPNDQSISRVHAHLSAGDQSLTVKDSSKYGTFVNEESLSGDTPRNLKSGDRLTFGVFHSKFRVEHKVILVCSSCLDMDGKTSLSQALVPLGGRMVNTWTQDCTYLVMPSVKVTIKTICALLCCRPIVKQNYFSELIKAIKQKQKQPKVESFCPDIDEPSLNKDQVDLSERPERKRLFTDRTFVFLSSKQLKRLSSAVTFGGGRSHLLEEGQLPVSLLESPWSCVVDIVTGNSQAISPSTRKWADSVGQILQKKGCRFITESEIGLAAIYVSCDKYCNPANEMGDSDSMRVRRVLPRSSLSQNTAVEETVLQAASQNITAYVVNTETSQRMDLSGVTAVGETPERNQSRGPSRLQPSPGRDQAASCTVAETMMSSFPATENTGVPKTRSTEQEARGRGNCTVSKFLAPPPQSSGSLKMSPQKGSHQKPKPLLQGSPHKQSSLTSFFQSVNKKRPREEGLPAESEPKRSAPPHSDATHTSTRPQTSSHCPSTSRAKAPPVSTQASGADLFPWQPLSDRASSPAQQGLQTRKRKEMEEDEVPKGSRAGGMEIEELESIMSEEMVDFEDEQMSQLEQSSTNRKQAQETVKHTSTNKKQHLQVEEHGTPNQRVTLDPVEGSAGSFQGSLTALASASKKQQVHPESHHTAGHTTPHQTSSLDHQHSSSANTNLRAEVKDEDVSFVEDGAAGVCGAELGACPESSAVKQEVPGADVEDVDLPRRLLQVEFKSLMVTEPSRTRPASRTVNGHSQGKNFKRFRKVPVPATEGLPNIIGGSDLLAHHRGTSHELDDWLREAAEEERQSRCEETLGDDLFRYNPKPAKRK
ncbi:nibrin [Hypomesus transpacificus]|uniref:nibrin n=1 Tax=Hypomesus transpacificus TaxID=137520 RepID=UPI001F08821A|nr:nibrin [Hypomesus transpacificus]